MTDTVKIWSLLAYHAWPVPQEIFVSVPSDPRDGMIEFPAANADPAVIDGLAWQWLEHLYAGLNRPNPFGRPDCPRIVLANIPSTQPTTTMTELDGLARGINFAQKDRT